MGIEKLGITPGPWEAEEDDDRLSRPFYISYTPKKGAIQYVCELGDNCTDHDGYTEYRDAHLIAQSPEMLTDEIENLSALEWVYENCNDLGMFGFVIRSRIENTRETILKACPGKSIDEIKELMK